MGKKYLKGSSGWHPTTKVGEYIVGGYRDKSGDIQWYPRYDPEKQPVRRSTPASRYNEAAAEARQANEERYQRILDLWENYKQQALDVNAEISDQLRADVRETVANLGTQRQQSLVDRGLAGSTVAENFRAGDAERLQEGLRRVGDEEARRELNILGNIVPRKLRFMERRTDSYPNPQFLFQQGRGQGQLAGMRSGGSAGGGRRRTGVRRVDRRDYGPGAFWSKNRPGGSQYRRARSRARRLGAGWRYGRGTSVY